ncbi:uncharacterized protein LOC144451492 isoform X2 [Glandiceps talaboti]
MCRPGYKVSRHCNDSRPDSTECRPCPQGYYSSEWTGAHFCSQINSCSRRNEHIEVEAPKDGTANNVCQCDSGYQYSPSGEHCMKSFTTDTTTNAIPTTVTSMPTTTGSQLTTSTSNVPTGESYSSQLSTAWIVGLSGGVLVLCLFFVILAIVCYRKKWCPCHRKYKDAEREGDRVEGGEPADDNVIVIDEVHLSMLPKGNEDVDEGTGTCTGTNTRQTSTQSLSRLSDSSGVEEDMIINLPDEPGAVGMTEKDRNILGSFMPDLVKDLPVDKVLDAMHDIFDEEDNAAITNTTLDSYEQRRKLVTVLMTKGPFAFNKFIEVLKKLSPHLATALKKAKAGNGTTV